MKTESEKIEEFKNFKAGLSITPYGDYYVLSVLSFLDKCVIGRKININSFFDNENQRTDRIKLQTAIDYIDSAGLLKDKIIRFEERTQDEYIFFIDTKINLTKKEK